MLQYHLVLTFCVKHKFSCGPWGSISLIKCFICRFGSFSLSTLLVSAVREEIRLSHCNSYFRSKQYNLLHLIYNFACTLTINLTGAQLSVQFACIPLLTSYPYIALLSGVTLTVLLTCASVLKNILSVSSFTT